MQNGLGPPKIPVMPDIHENPGNGRLLTVSEASAWASERLGRDVTTSNISYLVNYGRIRKESNGGADSGLR